MSHASHPLSSPPPPRPCQHLVDTLLTHTLRCTFIFVPVLSLSLSQAAQSADAAAIRAHLFYVLRELLRVMRNLGVAFADEELGKTAWDLTKLQMLDSHSDVHSYGRDLSLVLADPAVTKVLSNSDEAPLSTHTGWFLSQHERILSPAYVPAPQDLLRLRVRTTGVARHTLRRLGHTVEFVDVGGMRAERRKWAEIRLESDLVVFVASLADFGRSLAEDDETNRLAESLTLYKETLAALSEQRTAHCLVLTHDDELRRLLEADAAKVTAALETAVGARIDAAAHEGGSIEALHVAAVGAVRSKFAECGSAAMTLVVDSTDVATSRPLIDAALLLGVARHLRSKQSRGPPSALHDFEDARDILSHFPPPPTPVGLRRAMVGEPRATSPPATI